MTTKERARKRMPKRLTSPKGKRLGSIGKAILPKKIDGRTIEGRRLKTYARLLAAEATDASDPLVRSRILSAAALRLYAETLAWRLAKGEKVDGVELRKADEAADRAEARLKGKGLNHGHPKADGSPAQPRDNGSRDHARSLGVKLRRDNGIDAERFLDG